MYIRLEENAPEDASNVASESAPFEQQLKILRSTEKKEVAKLSEHRRAGNNLEAAKSQRVLNGIRSEITKKQTAAAQTSSQAVQQGDPYSIEVLSAPVDMGCEINSYRMLDTLDVTIPFRDAPFESFIVRSCLIEMYLGQIPPEAFQNPSNNSLPLDKSTIMFRGYVDTWETKHSNSDAVVQISARSLEKTLVDTKVHPESPLYRVQGDSEKISAYVNRVLSIIPSTSGRTGGSQLRAVYYHADAGEEPVLSRKVLIKALQSASSQSTGGRGVATVQADSEGTGVGGAVTGIGQARIAPAMDEMSAWDLITQACSLAGGLVASYDPSVIVDGQRGDFILIRPAQTIYDSIDGLAVRGGAPDGFARNMPDPNSPNVSKRSEVRFIVWGNNITEVGTSRKLGRIKVPVVEVRSYNPDAPAKERQLVVRYPPVTDKRVTSIGSKGDGGSEEVHVKYLYGVRDKAQLEQHALALYHSIGRNELVINIETSDMTSYFDPNNPDLTQQNTLDMLRVRHGTPIKVLVARQVREGSATGVTQALTSPLSELYERRGSELERFLMEQQGRFNPTQDPEVRQTVVKEMAQRLTGAIQAARTQDLYYCRKARHTYSVEDGWSCSMELVNFIQIRSDPRNMSPTTKNINNKRRIKAGQ